MGFHVDLEELHKAANKLNQEASRIETQLTDAKNSVNKIITSEALQGKTGQAIYQQLNNVDAAVLVGLADTSKVLASEFSSLLSSFHSSIGETSNSAILDEDYLNQLKDNLNNFKNQHGAQEENISSIYASISDLISLSGPQSNYNADSDTASQLLSTTIDKVTSFDSSGTAPTSADLLAAIDTEVNQVSQTTDLPYTDSQYLSFISDVNFAKSIKSVDKQITQQEKLAKEQAEQKARKEWAKQHPVVAWLQSQADLDANFFEGARKTLEKQNWDFFGGQLDKSVALTALGFVDGVCETIDKLALGAAQLGQLAFEGIEWGGNTLFKQKTPQWLKDDVTGAWNNVMAASEFGTRLIALDADAWNAVAKTGEKVGSDLSSAIKTGDDYKIGGYLFDVATFVGPAAVGKLKYVDEASALTKLTETSEVASTVGKVEDGVKVVDKVESIFKNGTKIKQKTLIDIVPQKTVDITDKIQNTGKFNSLGQEIVTFNNRELSPTVKAKSWQGDGLYPGVDEYVDIHFNKGDKIYILESDFEVANKLQSGYATTLETVEQSGYDSRKLSESLQIKPYYNKKDNPHIAKYRPQVTEYTITSDDSYAAFGERTVANPHFGNGGAPQYFIKDFQNQVSSGKLSRGTSQPLTNFEISAKDYKEMLKNFSK